MKPSIAGWTLIVLAVVTSVLGISMTRAPAALPESAAAEEFSAMRARRHLESLARRPHPMGTAEHERVRHYILRELEALGLEPEIQEAIAVRPRGVVAAGRVVNVAARLAGRRSSGALLLVTHYDSVPAGPGAGDDGAGVAAMLETLRALRQGSPPANDVIFLFTDGEEAGLLGAQAFSDDHPWAREVSLVLNFEARGTRGPAIMFETSDGNGRLIRELRRAGVHPVATSYSYEIYKRLPNDTDFSVFKRAGLPGLNFAFIHGATAYHTAQDSLDNLDLASLQHHGESMLGLVRHWGEIDLGGELKSGNAVYFNALGSFLVTYPQAWVLPLAILLLAAQIAWFVVARRRGASSAGGTLGGLLLHLLGAAVVGGLLFVATPWLVDRSYNFALWNGWSSISLSFLALALLSAGLAIAIRLLLPRKLSSGHLLGGGLLVWLILAGATAVLVPGASYLFALPLLLGLAASFAAPAEPLGKGPFALSILATAVTVLLWAPTLALIGVALGSTAAPLVGVMVFSLLLGPLLPALELIPRRHAGILSGVLVVLALGLVFAVRLASGFGDDNRRFNSVLYTLDTETEEALWLSYDRRPDPWTSQFLTESPERGPRPAFLVGSRPVLKNAAPRIPLEGAEVVWRGAEATADGHLLQLGIHWPWKADRAVVYLRSAGEIRALSIAGKRAERSRNTGPGDAPFRMVLIFFNPPPEGISLEVEAAGTEPLEVEVVGQRYGLPRPEGFSYEPRSADTMPRPGWAVDSTMIRSTTTWVPGSPPAAMPEAPATQPVEEIGAGG